MQVYSVSENGALRKVKKMTMVQDRVYLVDDIKIIYLWFGLKASNKKMDASITKAKKLTANKEGEVDIQMIKQNEEYGSFLAIMDILKHGITENAEISRRPELEIEIEDTLELIDAGLEPDFEAEITVNAHKLAKEKKSYEELCKMLAEIQFKMMKVNPSAAKLRKKAQEIFKSSSTYEELCWLISELTILNEKG
ncbi:MAG: hypothetical protein ACTSR8_07275 [Promethearchaeota archaeon]